MQVVLEACCTVVAYYLKTLACVVIADLLVPFIRSPRARYYACYFCYVMTASLVSVLYLPVFILRFRDPTNMRRAAATSLALSRLLGISWEPRGAEVLSEAGAAVVAVTHQSMFDPMGLITISNNLGKGSLVGRKELLYVWPLGPILWIAGVIFIDRNRGREAQIKLMKTMEGVKKNKVKLVMFPEGTRNRKGKTLLPFKKGAFRLAIQAQIPIIPIVLSPYYFIDAEKKTFHKGKVIMSTLPPIPTKGKTMEEVDMLVEITQAIMEEEYQKLKSEIKILRSSVAS